MSKARKQLLEQTKEIYLKALYDAGGSITAMANILGVNRTTLRTRLDEMVTYGILDGTEEDTARRMRTAKMRAIKELKRQEFLSDPESVFFHILAKVL